MATWKRWQDWVNVVLGVLLFVTPFVFNGMTVQAAEWTAFGGGVLLVVVGLWILASPANQIGEWLEGVLGLLVFIAPWLLGFTALNSMAWSAWVVGVLAVLLAGSVLFGSGADRRTLVGQH
jgi:uncharacterized membrane protein